MDYVHARHRRNEFDGDVVEYCQQEEECLDVLEHIGSLLVDHAFRFGSVVVPLACSGDERGEWGYV